MSWIMLVLQDQPVLDIMRDDTSETEARMDEALALSDLRTGGSLIFHRFIKIVGVVDAILSRLSDDGPVPGCTARCILLYNYLYN